MKNLLLVSSSNSADEGYLGHARTEMLSLFEGVTRLVFVPFARPGGMSHDEYTRKASGPFAEMGIEVKGVHEFPDPAAGIAAAQAVFIGGGNTFLLLKGLYESGVLAPLRDKIQGGMPYMGTSAGSNVAGQNICNTNDMPIVYPPSFEALGAVPFNLNPHFVPGALMEGHHGESREKRIREFHYQSRIPVVGIREDSMIRVRGGSFLLLGKSPAVIFRAEKGAQEIPQGSELGKWL